MTPVELVAAAEARLADAERNLATCVASLNFHKESGSVPTAEVVALSHAQAAVAQAFAAIALAKAGVAMLEAPAPVAPCEHAPDGGNHPDVGHG